MTHLSPKQWVSLESVSEMYLSLQMWESKVFFLIGKKNKHTYLTTVLVGSGMGVLAYAGTYIFNRATLTVFV